MYTPNPGPTVPPGNQDQDEPQDVSEEHLNAPLIDTQGQDNINPLLDAPTSPTSTKFAPFNVQKDPSTKLDTRSVCDRVLTEEIRKRNESVENWEKAAAYLQNQPCGSVSRRVSPRSPPTSTTQTGVRYNVATQSLGGINQERDPTNTGNQAEPEPGANNSESGTGVTFFRKNKSHTIHVPSWCPIVSGIGLMGGLFIVLALHAPLIPWPVSSNNLCDPSFLPSFLNVSEMKSKIELDYKEGKFSWMYPCKNAVGYNIGFMKSLYELVDASWDGDIEFPPRKKNKTELEKRRMALGNCTHKFALAYAMTSSKDVNLESMNIGFDQFHSEVNCHESTRKEPEFAMLHNTRICTRPHIKVVIEADEYQQFQTKLLAYALLFGEFRENLVVLKSDDKEAVEAWDNFTLLARQKKNIEMYSSILRHEVTFRQGKEIPHPLFRAAEIQVNKFNIARMRMMYQSPKDGQTWTQYCSSIAEDLGM